MHKSLAAYSRMESGASKIPATDLHLIAEALECNTEDLVFGTIINNGQLNQASNNTQNIYQYPEKFQQTFEQFVRLMNELIQERLSKKP